MKPNIAARLHAILDLLDEGFALYRRSFTGFVLVGLVWLTPIAIATGLLIANAERLGPGWFIVIILVGLVLMLPMLIYLIGGLSRAANAAIEGRAIDLRETLALYPSVVAKAGCFTVTYGILMQVVSSLLSIVCICPIYVFLGISLTALVAAPDSSGVVQAILLIVIGLLFMGMYLLGFIIGGIGYSSLLYALQPWLIERLRFGEAMERSFDLIRFRLRTNLLAWGLSALLVFAVGISVSLAVGVLIPLPAFLLLGEESSFAQAIAGVAWLLGLALVLPPWLISMTLLYRRNLAARSGADLARRVEAWREKQELRTDSR
ncbi:MAG: hypothetical protein J7463_02010 [Roseiflexus sp.]|nr:hypothetical protein [Roseiflexus sp.]